MQIQTIFFFKISVEKSFGFLPNTYKVYDEKNIGLNESNFTGYMTHIFILNQSRFIIKKIQSSEPNDVVEVTYEEKKDDAPFSRIYDNPTGYFKHVFLKVFFFFIK